MTAVVKEIQVGGFHCCYNLRDMCKAYLGVFREGIFSDKIIFVVELPDGEVKHITFRELDGKTIAYGDFEELTDFIEYVRDTSE